MKKIWILFLLFSTILIAGCKEEEPLVYETDLDYSSYLNETNPLVKIDVKDYGTIYVELFPSIAPITVDNFIAYVQRGSYSGSTFHRIIDGFMIQGGMVNDTSCQIKGEFTSNGFSNDLPHYKGVIAMARTSDPNSATSQFFINDGYSNWLDGQYASFGGVVDGIEVVEAISAVATNASDAPLSDVTINSISVDLRGYEPGERICYGD
jgi:peptidyl-prolyl cis-trans isomerase B (cyclophilin B)